MQNNKKKKLLFLISGIVLFLVLTFVGLKVYKTKAYTQTAWPKAGDNQITVRMAGPAGDGGITIKAKTNWGKADKTKVNFEKSSRTISLSAVNYGGNPYGATLQNTSVNTTKNEDGTYSIITFNVTYNVPAHYTAWSNEVTRSSNTSGRYNVTYSLGHYAGAQTVWVKYEVNLANFGIVVNSSGSRACGGKSVIRISRPSYNVGFNANGGTGTATRSGLCWCETAWAPTVSKTNSKLTGWYTSSGNYVCGANGGAYVGSYAGQTLYAHWEDYFFTVQYNPNSGVWSSNNSQDSQAVNVDKNNSSYKLKTSSELKRDNYTFIEWNTARDGTGTSYTSGQTIQTSNYGTKSTLMLYAIWRRNDYDVIFDPNGGSGSMPNQTIGRYTQANLNAFTGISKKGYTFVGWSTTPYTMNVEYKDQAAVKTLTLDDDTITLYAVWQKVGTGFVQRPLLDTKMFYKTPSLKGGNGTTFDPEKIDSYMAHIDTADNPGYFTGK